LGAKTGLKLSLFYGHERPAAFLSKQVEAELVTLVAEMEREIEEHGCVSAETAGRLHALRLKVEATLKR